MKSITPKEDKSEWKKLDEELDLELEGCRVIHVYDTEQFQSFRRFLHAKLDEQRAKHEIDLANLAASVLKVGDERYAKGRQDERVEIIKMCEEMKTPCLGNPEMMLNLEEQFRNKTLDDLIAKLK